MRAINIVASVPTMELLGKEEEEEEGGEGMEEEKRKGFSTTGDLAP